MIIKVTVKGDEKPIPQKGSALMSSILAEKQHFTINDIYNLPEGSRAELIDNQIYYMAPPSTRHQRILSFLHLKIDFSKLPC